MKTRILKQVKSFSIIAPPTQLYGQNIDMTLPSITYIADEVWESDEKCNQLLNKAIIDWQKKYKNSCYEITANKPALNIYWKTIEKLED